MSPTAFPPDTLVADKVTGAYLGITVDSKRTVPTPSVYEAVVFNSHNPPETVYMVYPNERLDLVGAAVVDDMREISAGRLHIGDLVHVGGELRVVRDGSRRPHEFTRFLTLSGTPHPDRPVPLDFPADVPWGHRDNYPIDLPVLAYCPDRC